MVVAGSTVVMNAVLLASAVVPPIVVVLLAWFFLRAGRRHDARERAAGRGNGHSSASYVTSLRVSDRPRTRQ